MALALRLRHGDALSLHDTTVERDRPVRGVDAGQQIVNRNAMFGHLPRRSRDIAGQARARSIGQAQSRDGRFDRLAGDIHHPTPAARHHRGQAGFHKGNWGQHIGVEGRDKISTVPIGP